MIEYLSARVENTPTISVPPGLRLPRGWEAFVVPPSGTHNPVYLSWPNSSAHPPGPARLRVTVALDEREEKLLEAFLPSSGQRLGILDIRYAHLFQPFELPLSGADTSAIQKEGCGLRLVKGEKPLWLFHDPAGEERCPAFMPHLLADSGPGSLDGFMERLASRASLQFFGWQEGCVLDGLYDLAQVNPGRGFEQAIGLHLAQFFDPDGRLQAEDDFSRPADGNVYGIEATLPYAVLAKIQPDHPALKTVLDFWLASRDADGSVQDAQGLYDGIASGKALTAEGGYTVAYPMAVLAAGQKNTALAQMAIRQLRIRKEQLFIGNHFYLRRFADGTLSFRDWSRGVAWFLLGLARTLAALPSREGLEDLEEELQRAAAWAIERQLPGGLWPVFLDDPGLTPDTAGSAGIAAALALGAKHNLLPSTVLPSARLALQALQAHLTPDGFLGGVAQVNKGGEALQRGTYRVISQMAMGMLGQLVAALQ